MSATSSTVFCFGIEGMAKFILDVEFSMYRRNECHVERGCGSLYPLGGTTEHWCDLTFIELSVVKLDYGKVSVIGVSGCDNTL